MPRANLLTKPRRLVLRRSSRADDASPATTPSTPTVTNIEFVAYAEDCILSGVVGLAADRLSDLINSHDELELEDVLVTALHESKAIEVRTVRIKRDEILVVHAPEPRGRTDRRQRTRQHAVTARLGPYTVSGYVHTLPGADPLTSLRRRPPMIAMTDAVIEFTLDGERQERHAQTLLLNHELADSIVLGTNTENQPFPDLTVEDGILIAKDFTGELRQPDGPDADSGLDAIARGAA